MSSDKNPTTEEYEWLINARVRIQKSLLDLHRLHESAKDHEKKPNKGRLGLGLGRLVGAAFSLWRAAPLLWHKVARSNEEEIEARGKVLNFLIRDNAINFPQDRASQDWMGGFYLNNAKERLNSLSLEDDETLKGYNLEGKKLNIHWDTVCSILENEINNAREKLSVIDDA